MVSKGVPRGRPPADDGGSALVLAAVRAVSTWSLRKRLALLALSLIVCYPAGLALAAPAAGPALPDVAPPPMASCSSRGMLCRLAQRHAGASSWAAARPKLVAAAA